MLNAPVNSVHNGFQRHFSNHYVNSQTWKIILGGSFTFGGTILLLMKSRREFLKTTCAVCGALVAADLLAGCKTAAEASGSTGYAVSNGVLTVPVSVVSSEGSIIEAQGLPRPVFVTKKTDGSYEALLLRCTHMNGKLNRTAEGFTCVLHGSRFSLDGKVLKGPAKEPLIRYAVTQEGDKLLIRVA